MGSPFTALGIVISVSQCRIVTGFYLEYSGCLMQDDPYAPPSTPVVEIDDPSAPPRRPKWVWVISMLYVLGGLWSLFITTMMHTGTLPTPPGARAYYDSLGLVDTLTFVSTALNVIGGILLFRLRARA